MDTIEICIFIGFILCGVIIAAPIAYSLGQRSMIHQLDRVKDSYRSILDSEYLEERRR